MILKIEIIRIECLARIQRVSNLWKNMTIYPNVFLQFKVMNFTSVFNSCWWLKKKKKSKNLSLFFHFIRCAKYKKKIEKNKIIERSTKQKVFSLPYQKKNFFFSTSEQCENKERERKNAMNLKRIEWNPEER